MTDEPQKKFMMRSEYSMGQYDFIRYDRLLSAMDELSVQVSSYNVNALLPFHSVLWELFKNFSPIMIDIKREEYKSKFKNLRDRILEEINRGSNDDNATIDQNLIDELDDIQIELLGIKQIIGLGIMISKDYSREDLIKKGLIG